MSNRPFKVRDVRIKEKFFVDDAYLNGFSKHLTPATSLVYFHLCRRVNNEQMAWPSERTIASDSGLSERGVRNAINTLERHHLIFKERITQKGKRWHHTVYTLVDKSYWLCPDQPAKSAGRYQPAKKDNINRQNLPTKVTQIEGSYIYTLGGKKRPVDRYGLAKRRKELVQKLLL